MVSGPCLCGDPYCGSCGDPFLADWEDAMDRLDEVLSKDLNITQEEFELLIDAIPMLINSYRGMVKAFCRNCGEDVPT